MPAAIPAAIVAGSVVSGVLAKQGASKAARAAQGAADQSVAEQQRQFDLLRSDQAHYRQLGDAALTSIEKINSGDLSGFYADPGRKFSLEQGQQAIDRSMLARGRGLSGAAAKEGIRFAEGTADQSFNNYYNRLAGQAGIGQNSATFTGQAGMNMANNIGGILQNSANARGSAYMQGAAGLNDSIQGGLSNYLLMQYMKPSGAK